jgi:hypothetical protein
MVRRWVAGKMPELKDVDIDVVLGLYLRSEHCKRQPKMQVAMQYLGTHGKELTGE